MKCTQRLYLNADKTKAVPAGHKDAATLYAVPGDEIPESAAERFGLVDGHLKGSKPDDGEKEKGPAQDKEKQGGGNKGGEGGGTKSDDLSALKGVGAKTAETLANAGYTSFAAIAAIDPAAPPSVEGIAAVFNWADVVASAKAKVAEAGAAG